MRAPSDARGLDLSQSTAASGRRRVAYWGALPVLVSLTLASPLASGCESSDLSSSPSLALDGGSAHPDVVDVSPTSDVLDSTASSEVEAPDSSPRLGFLEVDRPDPWDLGTVAVQMGVEIEEDLHLRNVGEGPLDIQAIALTQTDGFSLVSVVTQQGPIAPPYSLQLAPESTAVLRLAFSPTHLGAVSSSLLINHEADHSQGIAALSLRANGVAPVLTLKSSSVSKMGSERASAFEMSSKIITAGNSTIVAWLDAEPEYDAGSAVASLVRVRALDRTNQTWGATVTLGQATDNHGGPAIASDSSGIIHAIFGPHNAPFEYRHTKAPFDVSDWSESDQLDGKATYPSLVIDGKDTLHLAYRGEPTPHRLTYRRRPKGGTWSSPQQLVDADIPVDSKSKYTQYGGSLAVDEGGMLHLGFHIYDEAKIYDTIKKAGKAFGYLRSSDGGSSWTCADDSPVSVPVTRTSPCMIESGPDLDMRIGNVAIAPNGTVWLAGVHYEKGPTVKLYRWTSSGWKTIDLLPFLAQHQPSRGLADATITFDSWGTLYVAATTVPLGEITPFGDPSSEIVLLNSFDTGATFDVHLVSAKSASSMNWLPSIERPFGAQPVGVPSMLYTHGGPDYLDFPTQVVLTSILKH